MKTTIEGYVVSNLQFTKEQGSLYLYGNPYGREPLRGPMDRHGTWQGINRLQLPEESFPEVTWETGPKKVRIAVEVEDA